MKKLYYIFLFIGFAHFSFGQITDVRTNYELAFDEMNQMLKGEIPISFKRAVFLTENAYLENQISYEEFQKTIGALANLTKAVVAADGLDYSKKDRKQVLLAGSIYRVMKDTLVIENPVTNTSFRKYPYTYDTADFWGAEDWTKMFVTKLLYTQSGNCHSLPVLYKILADELGAEAYLSITPNHTYIKQWNDKTGWYNTELTSGRFPYDAEIKNNSYIKHEAIVDGVYMDTLTIKENISYAINDLAQGYIKKFGYDDIETPIRWLDVALVYYPDFPNALILKSELLKKKYESVAKKKGEKNFLKPKDAELKSKFEELEKSYYTVHQVGYRRMPKEMYLNWLYRVRKDTTRKPHRFESPQPFKDYNYKVTVMTASDGYNYEFYDQEDTTRIGTVIINRLTRKIVKFVDPSKDDFPDEVISRMYDPYVGRFWQIDPLADHPNQLSLSPYNAFWNNPILYNDPDGQCPFCPMWPQLVAAGSAYFNRLSGATQRLASGTSSGIPSGANVPADVKQMQHMIGTLNDTKIVAQTVVDAGEGVANAINSIPGVEIVGDPLMAMYYGGVKGDGVTASMYSAGALVPFVSGTALNTVRSALSQSGSLRSALGIAKGSGTEAHHLIPVQALGGSDVVQKAVGSGFDFNGAINGIEAAGKFHTNHPAYNSYVAGQLNQFKTAVGGNYTGEQAKGFITNQLIPLLRQHFDAAQQSGQSLNQYFKNLNKSN